MKERQFQWKFQKKKRMDPIKILLADDHLIIRQGLRLIFETEPGFEIVGEAKDGVRNNFV